MIQQPSAPLPQHACDCHMHVFDSTYPVAATAALQPADASMPSYEELQSRLGFERHVLVQPSTYGTDNRLMLHSLKANASSARGVAVIDSGVSDQSLSELESCGVVGIRFNQVQIGATTMEMFDSLSARMNELAWHVQLHLAPRDLIVEERRLASSPAPIVLDHFGRICAEPMLTRSVFETLDRLLSTGNTWLKLSAPYLAVGSDLGELAELTSMLINKYPERMVWGTDWPHVTEKNKPDDAQSLAWLRNVIDDSEKEVAIFARNPSMLYHFDE